MKKSKTARAANKTKRDLRDWERSICELVDRIVENPTRRHELTERLVDEVEDLVITAYLRGRNNAQTNARN